MYFFNFLRCKTIFEVLSYVLQHIFWIIQKGPVPILILVISLEIATILGSLWHFYITAKPKSQFTY